MFKRYRFEITTMVVCTVVSVLVAVGAIRSAARYDGGVELIAQEASRDEEGDPADFATLVAALAAARSDVPDHSGEIERDPLRPYETPKPKPVVQKPKPSRPKAPSYVVAAVIIDENPRAIVYMGDQTTVVKVGDVLGSKKVVAIAYDGVTVEGGTKYKYPSGK